jgi:hypothetical protein
MLLKAWYNGKPKKKDYEKAVFTELLNGWFHTTPFPSWHEENEGKKFLSHTIFASSHFLPSGEKTHVKQMFHRTGGTIPYWYVVVHIKHHIISFQMRPKVSRVEGGTYMYMVVGSIQCVVVVVPPYLSWWSSHGGRRITNKETKKRRP